jgi:hypothetical protein
MRLLIALSCLASLGLSSCSNATSSTADPPPTPPTVSQGTDEPSPSPTPETPEEFVRRWVAVANQLGRDGEPGPLLAASHQCDDCSAIARGVAQIYDAGGWIHGGDWQLVGEITVDRHGPRFVCGFELEIEPGMYRASADASVQTTPGGSARIRATMSKVGGELKMNDFVRLAQ